MPLVDVAGFPTATGTQVVLRPDQHTMVVLTGTGAVVLPVWAGAGFR